MPTVPESTKTSLAQKLTTRAHTTCSKLADLDVRYRGQFVYVDGKLADGESIKLMRLRYGSIAGTPEEALDCACGLYVTAPGI